MSFVCQFKKNYFLSLKHSFRFPCTNVLENVQTMGGCFLGFFFSFSNPCSSLRLTDVNSLYHACDTHQECLILKRDFACNSRGLSLIPL
uniref:Uncharacterized protein n=1 Tax=Anguilla anguilla TaxID=7936 RepID=A0A0E9X041_ANGAN